MEHRDFVGCMRDLYIDSKRIDLASFIANNGTSTGNVSLFTMALAPLDLCNSPSQCCQELAFGGSIIQGGTELLAMEWLPQGLLQLGRSFMIAGVVPCMQFRQKSWSMRKGQPSISTCPYYYLEKVPVQSAEIMIAQIRTGGLLFFFIDWADIRREASI